jgi:hypothetical protein
MDGWMDGWTDGRTDGQIDRRGGEESKRKDVNIVRTKERREGEKR